MRFNTHQRRLRHPVFLLGTALLTWTLATTLAADAPPPISEQALLTLLEGNAAGAVRLLDAGASGADADPTLRWLAARVALDAKDFKTARRLLEGDSGAVAWTRVDLLLAEGKADEAAQEALRRMEDALNGTHRDALALKLHEWASARLEKDPSTARSLLATAWKLAGSESTQLKIEARYFPLLEDVETPSQREVLEQRLAKFPEHMAARLLKARVLAAQTGPRRLDILLEPVIQKGEKPLALAASRMLVNEQLPPPTVSRLLDVLLARFPGDAQVGELLLSHAKALTSVDSDAGERRLEALSLDPVLRREALVAWATAGQKPEVRRTRWLKLANLEGASELGAVARRQATETLLAAVLAAPEGDARRKAAAEALKEPDAQGNPVLRFYSLPPVIDASSRLNRLEALWELQEKYPTNHSDVSANVQPAYGATPTAQAGKGVWCNDLAQLLTMQETPPEVAKKFVSGCSSADAPEAQALEALEAERPYFHMRPGAGKAELLLTGADRVDVTEHDLDPLTLFRASSDSPLNATLNAYLTAPDRSWSQTVPTERVVRRTLNVTGNAPLVAMTVRAGTLRSTLLVARETLEIQTVAAGTETAYLVLKNNLPVAGASLTWRSSNGQEQTSKTDASGLGQISLPAGRVRVLAQSGAALGYTALQLNAPQAPSSALRLVLADRAFPVAGTRGSVAILSTRMSEAAPEKLALVSLGSEGTLIEERTITLKGGWANAEMLLQGGGSLQLKSGERTLSTITLPVSSPFADRDQWSSPHTPELPDDVAISISPAEPEAGDTVTMVAWRLGEISPDSPPLRLEAQLGGSSWKAQAPAASKPVTLFFSLPRESGDQSLWMGVRTTADLPDPLALPNPEQGQAKVWHRKITLKRSDVASPVLPGLVMAGATIPGSSSDDAWWTVAPVERPSAWKWMPPGAPLVLQTPGGWLVTPWRNGVTGRTQQVTALDPQGPVGQDGKLQDTRPTLWVQSDQHIRRIRLGMPGTLLELNATSDTQRAWWTPGRPELKPVPLLPAPPPPVTVSGTLTRADSSRLELGLGLPPGTRLWAYLTDASDGTQGADLPDLTLPSALSGSLGTREVPVDANGSPIEGALLEQEALEAEEKEEQSSLDELMNEELAAPVTLSLGGAGHGGGGYGAASSLGRRQMAQGPSGPTLLKPQGTWPHSLALLENAAPGNWQVRVPESTTQVHLRVLARLPSGALIGTSRLLEVEGSTPQRPSLQPYTADEAALATPWDGTFARLLTLARTLPLDARALALTALERQGHAELHAEQVAVTQAQTHHARQQYGSSVDLSGLRLSAFLKNEAPPIFNPDPEALTRLPDARLTERAQAALNSVSSDPERATAAARRILEATELPASARLRASLALWLTGHPYDAQAGLSGTDPLTQAAASLLALTGPAAASLTLDAAPELLRLAMQPLAEPLERALALQALGRLTGKPVTPAGAAGKSKPLTLTLYAPLATVQGVVLSRGFWGGREDGPPIVMRSLEAPAQRQVPISTEVGPFSEPSRVVCPQGPGLRAWPEVHLLPPLLNQTTVWCRVWTTQEGTHDLSLRWIDPRGQTLASGNAVLTTTSARASSVEDPMSSSERLELAILLGQAGKSEAIPLLKRLLGSSWIPEQEVRRASRALFAATLKGADPAALVSAFEGWRERASNAELPLSAASSLARALAATQKPARAVAAARLVMDARLQEELEAVSVLQAGALRLTAVNLLKLLLSEYPEVPTAREARYLGASSLLELADASEPPVGASRTTLRRTGAEQLARTLLLDSSGPQSADAAALLLDTLQLLREPEREEALAGPLAKRFAQSPLAWRMVVSSARAQVARGRFVDAVRSLEKLEDEDEGKNEVALTLGRALEGLGRIEEALEQYEQAGPGEAAARRAYLTRSSLDAPSVLVFGPRDALSIRGWLPPGTPVKVLAYQIALEDLLLRDGGTLTPEGVRVDGLRPAASLERSVGKDGDIGLPALKEGAYLLTISYGTHLRRILALRTELELWVQPGGAQGGRSLALASSSGSAIADASIWVWQPDGQVERLRTDIQGHGFSSGGGVKTVLARKGGAYAIWMAREEQPEMPSEEDVDYDDAPAPAQSQMRSRLLQKSNQDWNQLFENRARSQVRASEL